MAGDNVSSTVTGGINTTIDDVVEALNNKADRDLANTEENWADTVVEYQINSDGSWYRLWKSGFCEQAGYFIGLTGTQTVTLFKEYKDTNYNIQLTESYTTTLGDARAVNNSEKLTTSFQIFVGSAATVGIYWKTEGFCEVANSSNDSSNDSGSGSNEETEYTYKAWVVETFTTTGGGNN